MALIVITWDLPPAEQIDSYNEKSSSWISMVLNQPELGQFRGYRNAFRTTPMAMIHLEFDSLASCLKFIESEDYALLEYEMRASGVTNMGVQLWSPSPVIPQPLSPTNG